MKVSVPHWWLSMSYLNILLLQVEVLEHACILHDLCVPAATIFSVEDFKCTCTRFAALCLFVCVV